MMSNVEGTLYASFADIHAGSVDLSECKIMWWHYHKDGGVDGHDQFVANAPEALEAKNEIRAFYENGGALFLTRYATNLPSFIGTTGDDEWTTPNNCWGQDEDKAELCGGPWDFKIYGGQNNHPLYAGLIAGDDPNAVYCTDAGYHITNSTAQYHIGTDWGDYPNHTAWETRTKGTILGVGGDGAVVAWEYPAKDGKGGIICIGSVLLRLVLLHLRGRLCGELPQEHCHYDKECYQLLNEIMIMKTKIFSTFAIMLSALTLTACSEDSFGPDPEKDWAGTTAFFNSTDEKGFLTYYHPAIGRCGDPMPFYDEKEGEYKVLYLQEYDNNGPCYHPFWGISTTDGAYYESLGEVLPTGTSVQEADAALGTGCAIYNEQETNYITYITQDILPKKLFCVLPLPISRHGRKTNHGS